MRLLNSMILIGIIFFQINCKGQINDFPIILQESAMQCGPICLQMIGKYYGRDLDIKELEIISKMDNDGTSLLGLSEAADSIGLKNLSVKIPFETLINEAPLPAIVHWNQNHFVVIYKASHRKILVADPAIGKIEYTKKEFCENWIVSNGQIIISRFGRNLLPSFFTLNQSKYQQLSFFKAKTENKISSSKSGTY